MLGLQAYFIGKSDVLVLLLVLCSVKIAKQG